MNRVQKKNIDNQEIEPHTELTQFDRHGGNSARLESLPNKQLWSN